MMARTKVKNTTMLLTPGEQRGAGRRGGQIASMISRFLGCYGIVVLLVSSLVAVSGSDIITVERPYLIDSKVINMQWVNSSHPDAKPHEKVVFVHSEQGSIYRSADDGKNWVSQRDKLNSFNDDEVKVRRMIFSQADPNYLIMQGFEGGDWYSKDQGASYSRHDMGTLIDIKMHPKNPEWVLVSKRDEGQSDFLSTSFSLFVTTDFGVNWKKLASDVLQFDWGHPSAQNWKDKTIYACLKRDGSPDTTSSWNSNIDFVVSHDFFGSNKVVVEHGNRFAVHTPYWFVAAMNPEEEMEISMWVASDHGVTFNPAHFPYKLSERAYRVVETKEDAVFVQVTHSAQNAMWANVYSSGKDGKMYSLSLRHAMKNNRGMSDFERINGVDGVYIANTADLEAEDGAMSIAGSLASFFGGSAQLKVPTKSKITFDKGGLWENIKAPTKDSMGKSIEQCEDCSLHLHGKTSTSFGPVYSSPTSSGLIMATGNVGKHLHEREDEVNTYFSRDAGRSWEEIRKGSYIYEYGDHGALMLLVDNAKATNTLVYSWDEGLTWNTYQFWDHSIEVENIITEPSGTSQIFILYGRRYDKGVLMQINFETLHERRCQGFNAPGPDSSSDYEAWVPADDLRSGKCLMGKKMTYVRRKRDAKCFNGHEFDRVSKAKDCVCERTDFECDFGYELNSKKECNPIPDMPASGGGPPSSCSGTYKLTKGYRKVPGDTCVGGDAERDYAPVEMSCPGFGAKGVVLLFAVASLAVVFAVFTYYRRKEQGLSDPWSSPGDFIDFFKEGGKSLFTSSANRYGYGMLNGTEMMDDDDFGLGEDDDDAQVLGESLHEYALGNGSGSALNTTSQSDEIAVDMINLSEVGAVNSASDAHSTPRPPTSAPPASAALVPKMDPPPRR